MIIKSVSVIMPVFLGEYEGCATDRESKFSRAVECFLNNKYNNKELVIVSDACDISEKIYNEKYKKYDCIVFHKMPDKQPLFSGILRSKGLELASGQLIMYLDSDDIIGMNHINSVVCGMEDFRYDWCYYNDYIKTDNSTHRRSVILEHGSIGTSSIAHMKQLNLDWSGCDGYGHDWMFVKKLMKSTGNYGKVFGTEYFVCHIPNTTDF
jgi:glycosyltransferase involved in cell wall biosynthesis